LGSASFKKQIHEKNVWERSEKSKSSSGNEKALQGKIIN
jgi:hypothetical protein